MGFSFLDCIRNTDVKTEAVILNEAPEEDSGAKDDDFFVDASLDDDGGDSESGDDASSGDDSSSDFSSDSGAEGEDETSEEAIEDNGAVFASLTAEEQQIKIEELKRLFNAMYTNFDDISEKINNIGIEEYNKEKLTKITYTIYDLKQYIADYIIKVFPKRSYFENDVAYNRFLDIIFSINELLNKMAKDKNKENE